MIHPVQQRWLPLLILIAIVVAVGCQDRNSTATSSQAANPTQEVAAEIRKPENSKEVAASDRRISVAAKAKDELFTKLSARLMAVMQADGPVAAIDVCSKEAVTLADAVGKAHGVEIGRTSYKLRNPANSPRDWAKPFVDNRTDTPQHVLLEDGSLGALFPIHLKVKCLMCHGQPDDILDVVKPQLANLYPNDDATGFKLDELRGWFWVEVN